jgi:hypothetical protein
VFYTKAIFGDFGVSPLNLCYLESNLNKKDLPVLRQLYVALTVNDPTEVTFVEEIFDGDFTWWFRLSGTAWFQKHLKDWKREADIKRKSKAFEAIVKEATSAESKNALQAARYLIDEPWKKSRTKAAIKAKEETSTAAAPSHISSLQEYMTNKSGIK